jgi:hypothetical protein
MQKIDECRLCKHKILDEIINLGNQDLTSNFPNSEDEYVPECPLILVKCSNCDLVQLQYSISQNEIYEKYYGYSSGISNTMRTHLYQYNNEIQSKINLCKDDYVLDIASNDATFLKYYPEYVSKVGCDPTGKQFKEKYTDISLIPTYFTSKNVIDVLPDIKYKVISSTCVFYDLPDPVTFAKDVYDLLENDGIWTLEQSYIVDMLESNSFDTICHEHLEYYSVKQIKRICDLVGFRIIDISRNSSNGGSFRVYVSKTLPENTSVVNEYLQNELKMGIDNIYTYTSFMERVNIELDKLKTFLKSTNNIYVYGASTKGNTLLQYLNVNNTQLPFAVERNPEKIGKLTPGTHIQIISEEDMRKNPPEYILVLPWHFKHEIIERENDFLENGGKLVFPLPSFEIISKKKKF